MRLHLIAEPGYRDDDGGVRQGDHVDLLLTDPHGFHQDELEAHGIEHGTGVVGRTRQSAALPAGPHRADEDPGIERVPAHAQSIAEQCAPGEGARRVHREHPDPATLAARLRDDQVHERGLARPRRPGDPHDVRAPGRGEDTLQDLAPARIAVIQPAYGAGPGGDVAGEQLRRHIHQELGRLGGQTLRPPGAQVGDDLARIGSHGEHARVAGLLQQRQVFGRDHPAGHEQLLAGSLFAQQAREARETAGMAGRERGDADDVHVLLDRSAGDGFGRLLEAGEDHLHAGIPQRVGDHGEADRMGVEAELGEQHPQRPRRPLVLRLTRRSAGCRAYARRRPPAWHHTAPRAWRTP